MRSVIKALDTFRDAVLGSAHPDKRELGFLVRKILAESNSPTGQEGCCESCGEKLPWQKTLEKACKTCISKQGTPRMTIALGGYENGLGVLMAAAKYGGWIEPLQITGELLGTEIRIRIGDSLKKKVIVPMPSPWIRKIHRGIDHSMVLAHAVSVVTQWPVHRVLKRTWVAPQVGSTRAARKRGGKGLRPRTCFTNTSCVQGKEVILIDDVRTTGTSLDRASRMCHSLGALGVIAGVVAMRSDRQS